MVLHSQQTDVLMWNVDFADHVQQFLVIGHDIYWCIIAELRLTGNWIILNVIAYRYYSCYRNEFSFFYLVAINDCSFGDKIIITSLL